MADGSVKIDIVADDSDIQKKVQDTEDSLDGLGDKQKETQKETEKTTSKFEELANAIDKQEKELSSLKGEYTQAIINFGKGSTEAKALEDKMTSLNSELSKNKETFSKASNEASKLSSALDENEKSFGTAEVAIGSFVGNALSNLASKLMETVGNIAALADETREYREDMAKLDTAFTTAGHSTETAQKAYDEFYKILGESDRSVEAVNHLAELTKNEQEVAQWSTIAAGVTAKFGDSLPIEGLTEAANETAKVGAVTGPLADALNWAGISEDEFNKKLEACNSEQERATLITETLNSEYAAAAEEYNKLTANTQAAREATNNMEQAQAALGAAIEPVTTAWTNMKANALQWFVDEGLPALQNGWQWIQSNLPAIAVIVGGLTAAWLAFGGAQTILNAVQTAGIAIQTALNAVMTANPIGLIILAITALVAGFMLLWNNCEGFRNFWIGLWEKIKTAAAAVADWFKNAWSATIEWLKGAVAGIKDFFSDAWEAIKSVWNNSVIGNYYKSIWETIKGVFAVVKAVLSGNWSDAWNAIKGIVNTWASFFSGIWDKIKAVFAVVGSWFSQKFTEAKTAIIAVFSNIKEKFVEIWTKIKEAFKTGDFVKIGTDLLKGLWNGINDTVAWLKGKVKGVVDKIKGWFTGKDGFDEHSPSKWAEQVAVYVNKGLADGFKNSSNEPVKAVGGVFEAIRKKVEEEQKKNVKTVADYNNEIDKIADEHNDEMLKLERENAKKLAELEEKWIEDKKKKNADKVKLDKEYAKQVKEIKEQFIEKADSLDLSTKSKIDTQLDNIQKTITGKMQELLTLGDTYKENVKKIWVDLEKSITDLQANYDNQLKSRTESIANSLNLWNEATKNTVTGAVLQKNLQSQVRTLEDYNEAIAKLEERNISEAFLNQIKQMGVGSTGEIEALAKMTEAQLSSYVELWEKKNELARNAAVEELEPLKAETESKIEELTNAALDKYAELRAEYTTQSSLLLTELKQAMIEAGEGGYEEIVAQIDEYTSAGEDLMNGVIAGIVDKSPELIKAVARAVNQSIQAAKDAAGIESPSKVMKKEVGANLAEGVSVGWAEKVDTIKNKMATDMQSITARIKTAVSLEQARMSQGVGVRDTGFAEVAQAVGMQTAGINSLASEYRRGSNAQVTVPLVIDGRELGRAIVDLGNAETIRTGTSLSFA